MKNDCPECARRAVQERNARLALPALALTVFLFAIVVAVQLLRRG